MTTKVNHLLRPTAKPRIVIEFDPVSGQSTMKVTGMNQIGVALCLCSQLNLLLPNMFKDMFANAKIMDAAGNPIPTNLNPAPNGDSMTIQEVADDTADQSPTA